MQIEKPKEGGNFDPTPEGQATGICCRVVDYGTHISTGMYAGKKQRKLMIGWELPEHRVTFTNSEGVETEGPVVHLERYTWSFHEKANLRGMLEGWRGVKFKDDDFDGPNAFNLRNLIGVPALMQIVHDVKDKKTYANLQTIMRSPVPKDSWPKPETDPIYLNLRDFNQAEFDKLSDYWQGLIKTTPEWAEMFGAPESSQEQNYAERESHAPEGYDDSIPF